ncbi:hypothetical protein [Herbaspirillum sp. RV1423]|uniref:hypothetical protein n=1 Tax=Herbaspirillum sp. RV1423 TaxID=1443993 RepID=UPI0004B992CD|nr:hypothetical protein [Herbaspirillum sp. RV1423]
MLTVFRSLAAWIAIACLAFASLLPLASLAEAKTPASAMAICSGAPSWQMPGSGSGQAGHAHCIYCSSQSYAFGFQEGNLGNGGDFRAALLYFTAQAPQRAAHPYLLREDSWARAPPA